MPPINLPSLAQISAQVEAALREDIGDGDISAALIAPQQTATAEIISRQTAVLCGRPWVDEVFKQLDTRVVLNWYAQDSEQVQTGQCLCRLEGAARSLLSGERCALNFLQTLSATASRCADYVAAVADTHTIILDTRKTLPGLRLAQKYAVVCGGGSNHRFGLYDAFLIKENHIAAAGSIGSALQQARALHPDKFLEIEVENLLQLEEARAYNPDRILLDNFSLEQLRNAVKKTAGTVALEASGNISFQNIRAVAQTGVDFISIGGLTKDITAVDLSMRFV